MSLYDYDGFCFGLPVNYTSWLEQKGKSFPGRDASRRYDRFYHKRKPKKKMASHYHAHFGEHVPYSNGQTVHWNREHDPRGSIYGQIKETFSYEQAQLLYDHTDIYLYWRKPNKNITRPFYEGILRRHGYAINH